jgi:comEA protein
MQKILIFLKRYYYYFALGSAVLVTTICWYVPPLHAYLQSNFFPSQDVAVDIPSPSPTVDKLASVEELAKQTEQTVVQMQQQRQADLAQIRDLQDQYKKATAEVAKMHDAVSQESAQLQTALATMPLGTVASISEDSSVSATPTGKININTASATQLDALPGIGAAYAQRIIDYRSAHGPFKAIGDLDKVSGIGPATIDKIKNLVEV